MIRDETEKLKSDAVRSALRDFYKVLLPNGRQNSNLKSALYYASITELALSAAIVCWHDNSDESEVDKFVNTVVGRAKRAAEIIMTEQKPESGAV